MNIVEEAFRRRDDQLCERRQAIFASELGEHGLEAGNDPREHDHHDDDRHEKDGDWVHHRAADLSGELDALLDVSGKPIENGVEDTAHLTGANQVDEELVKELGMLAQTLRKRATLLDVVLHVLEYRVEGLVVPAARQDV